MPNCFQLFRKGSAEPEKLSVVDQELCALLDQPVHKRHYVAGWFDCIGFLIACKNDCSLGTQKLRDEVERWFEGDEDSPRHVAMKLCLTYLEGHYASDAWVQIGK